MLMLNVFTFLQNAMPLFRQSEELGEKDTDDTNNDHNDDRLNDWFTQWFLPNESVWRQSLMFA